MRRLLRRGVFLAALLLLAACGSEPGVTATRRNTATTPDATESTTATTTPTTEPVTTDPVTTSLPPVTTEEATTTTLPAPVGWHDIATMPDEAFPPCCASNWIGVPSPALPDVGEIPDGIYNASRIALSPDQATLTIEIRRYEACAARPDVGCEPLPDGYEYQPDELGIDPDVVRAMTIPLDNNVAVALAGWNADPVLRQATGTELSALFVALSSAYQEVIAAPLVAGADADAIIDSLLAAPARGFGPPPVEMYGALLYTYDNAPPLLFQGAFEYTDSGERLPLDPTSVVVLTAIQFAQGVTTLYFYAGYYP
ncbi:MAG TPA: hypothetical protein VH761_13635 [Ilumatobacteraceae bacterium]|jgi:hypothetical protein